MKRILLAAALVAASILPAASADATKYECHDKHWCLYAGPITPPIIHVGECVTFKWTLIRRGDQADLWLRSWPVDDKFDRGGDLRGHYTHCFDTAGVYQYAFISCPPSQVSYGGRGVAAVYSFVHVDDNDNPPIHRYRVCGG